MTAGTTWDESMDELVNPESFARQYGAAAGSWKVKGVESEGVFTFLPLVKQDRERMMRVEAMFKEIATYLAKESKANLNR